jgi:peptidyl-tRNA hydrolase
MAPTNRRQLYTTIPIVAAAFLLRRAANSFSPNNVASHNRHFRSGNRSLRFFRQRTMSSHQPAVSDHNDDEVDDQDDSTKNKSPPTKIVQYIFLRRDLAMEGWPAGAMAAQAAHAALAAVTLALHAQDAAARQYVSPQNLPNMNKQVYGVENDTELERVRQAWRKHFLSVSSSSSSTNMGTTTDEDKQQQQQQQQQETSTITSGGGGAEVGLYLWMEQPENIPTALATWPVVRTNKVSKVIKNLKLSYF